LEFYKSKLDNNKACTLKIIYIYIKTLQLFFSTSDVKGNFFNIKISLVVFKLP